MTLGQLTLPGSRSSTKMGKAQLSKLGASQLTCPVFLSQEPCKLFSFLWTNYQLI